MARVEEEYFFNEMDANKDGKISLKEMEAMFTEHMIPLTSKFEDKIPMLLNKIVSIEEDSEILESRKSNVSSEIEQKIRKSFKKLDYALNKKKLTLFQVFSAYDKDKNG